MDVQRWRRLEAIFHAAQSRSDSERRGYVAEACAGDAALQDEVESLLAQSDATADPMRTGGAAERAPADAPIPPPGSAIAHYRVTDIIGAGGMGVVMHAIDTRLNRPVALKIISASNSADPEWRRRFLQEARAASAFTHPNVVTVHGVDSADGVDFIVMEVVSGRPLGERIPPGGLQIDDSLAIAGQIASALDAAHAAGIVHRDIKPANVMISDGGQVKVLDFGIAKQIPVGGAARQGRPDTVTAPGATAAGVLVGSLAYMSPEQAQGKAVDGRSDVFAFGVLLYEMLTGRTPFRAATSLETLAKILESSPATVDTIRPDVPPLLTALISDCLEKDRERRPTAHEVHRRIIDIAAARSITAGGAASVARRRRLAMAAAVVTVALAIAGVAWWASGREVRAARRQVPHVLELADQFDFDAFFRVARTVVLVLPDDLQLKQAWINMTAPASFDSAPSGADVSINSYGAPERDWLPIGRTPIQEMSLPIGPMRVRLTKSGYATVEAELHPFSMIYPLDPVETVPEGMVHVPSGTAVLEGITHPLPSFWMDRYEVTNRQFKAFVDAGGYRRREWWTEPLVDGSRTLTFDEATSRLVDKTGRPGPSTWELGTYPAGQADFPVSGVSWYEAAAYAKFAGKSLPTGFQWRMAAGFGTLFENSAEILRLSNFDPKGPAAVGTHAGLSPWGTYDMAGNVKEWCWNDSLAGRLILGGGWNEPTYMFDDRDGQRPFVRLPTYGFRTVKNIDPQPAASYDFIPKPTRNYDEETPINDAQFEILRSVYAYDPRPLNVETTDSRDGADWRVETVTFDAAYPNERVVVHLYLPKSGTPPYQPIVYFPGGDAQIVRSSRDLRLTEADFIVRSGRALLFPIYKGTYEREAPIAGRNAFRDVTVARVKDFLRVVEFIGTRRDLDANTIGYYGISLGSYNGVIMTAMEPRVKASVLLASGFIPTRGAPEIDIFNFAPRVHVPTLMVNGQNDFTYPYESSQRPLFQRLGVAPDRKKHERLAGGHIPEDRHELMRVTLDWFDRFLGPVR